MKCCILVQSFKRVNGKSQGIKENNMSIQVKAECPCCNREIALTKGGKFRPHHDSGHEDGSYGCKCYGSGKLVSDVREYMITLEAQGKK